MLSEKDFPNVGNNSQNCQLGFYKFKSFCITKEIVSREKRWGLIFKYMKKNITGKSPPKDPSDQ